MLSRSQTVSEVGPCDDEGFVWKRGKWLGSWKKRYFMRKGTQLYSFEADDSTKQPISGARTTFELEFWRLEKVIEKHEKRPHMCKLVHMNNKQSFAMPSEAELMKWLVAINRTRVWIKYKRFIPQIITIQSQFRMRMQHIPFKRLKVAAESIQLFYRLQCLKAKYKISLANVVKCQATVRRFLCVRAHKRNQRRKRIVNELVVTETTYVSNLKTILELYANPLKVASQTSVSQILPPEEIKVLFGPLEPVYKINDEFCGILDKRLKSWSNDQKIGDQFIQVADRFKFVYVPYVLNYGEVCVILEKIRKKNQKFCDFLEAALEDNRSKGLDISSFLIQPVQRLPRYELLLKDLLKHTPKNHVDFEDLTKGLQRINDVAIFINEKKRDKENISLVTTLQGQLEGKLVETINWKPHHRLLREGEGQSTIGRKVNYIFLINEFLILAQKQKTTYQVRELISLREIEVNVLKSETTEQINFQRNGEKAGIIVPLTKNPWSDEISYQHQSKLDRRNSILIRTSSSTINSSSEAPLSPLSLLSSPPTSPVSPRGPSSSVPPLPLSPSLSFSSPSPRGPTTAVSPRGPSSPSPASPSPSPSPSPVSPTPVSPRNLSSHSSPTHAPLAKSNSQTNTTNTTTKPGGSSLKLSSVLPSFPRSRSEKNVPAHN